MRAPRLTGIGLGVAMLFSSTLSLGINYAAAAEAHVIPLAGSYNQGTGYGVPGPMWRWKGYHTGMDFGASTGSAVVAASDGTVTRTGWGGAYGNMTQIDHGGGVSTLYAHQSQIFVTEGQQVTAGQRIGAVGSTGNSTGPHLHFEVRVNDEPIDPQPWLEGATTALTSALTPVPEYVPLTDDQRSEIDSAASEVAAARQAAVEADKQAKAAQKRADEARARLAALQPQLKAAEETAEVAHQVLANYVRKAYITGSNDEFAALLAGIDWDTSQDLATQQIVIDYASRTQNAAVNAALATLRSQQAMMRQAQIEQEQANKAEAESKSIYESALDRLTKSTEAYGDVVAGLPLGADIGLNGIGLGTADIPPGGTKIARRAVAYALAQVGKPYCYDGFQGPSCFGCNGLSWRSWKMAGLDWPIMKAHDQATSDEWTVPVALGQESPGDLIFWITNNGTDLPGRIDHVGMIVDPVKGTFVHASNPRDGVKISNYKTESFYERPAAIARIKAQ